MSDGLNTVLLFGNLGSDPELRQTTNGAVLKLSLATSHGWLDKEKQKQEKTTWHRVTVFGPRGEGLAKILQKGSKLLVKGRIETSTYEKDGQKRYSTEIIAEDVLLGGGRANGAYSPVAPGSMALSDLPF